MNGLTATPAWESTAEGDVVLSGTVCVQCGAKRVPAQSYGCEVCGAPGADLRLTWFDGDGTIESLVTVWTHPTVATPFVLGEIRLRSGPTITALLTGDNLRLHGPVRARPGDESTAFFIAFSAKESD